MRITHLMNIVDIYNGNKNASLSYDKNFDVENITFDQTTEYWYFRIKEKGYKWITIFDEIGNVEKVIDLNN